MRSWRTAAANGGLACLSVLIVSAALADVPWVARVSRPLQPVTGALGLEQNWNVFAPRPRRDGLRLEALVTWSDGRRTVWRIPSGEPWIGGYRDYRWRKWAEHAGLGRNAHALWRPAALYVARRLPARRAAVPRAIRLVRYLQPVPPPGVHAERPWIATDLYEARLGAPEP